MKLEEMAGTVNLSKKEQMIFDYVLRHREEAAVMTGAELAEAAGVGDTTVIRLARTLGFDSLKSFRRFLQEEALSVKQALSRSDLFPMRRLKMPTAWRWKRYRMRFEDSTPAGPHAIRWQTVMISI